MFSREHWKGNQLKTYNTIRLLTLFTVLQQLLTLLQYNAIQFKTYTTTIDATIATITPEYNGYYFYSILYNNKINARVLIGQSAMVYCAGKPMEKSRVFWIII